MFNSFGTVCHKRVEYKDLSVFWATLSVNLYYGLRFENVFFKFKFVFCWLKWFSSLKWLLKVITVIIVIDCNITLIDYSDQSN